MIPFAALQEAVKKDVPDALKEAKQMFEEAKLYLQTTQEKFSLSLRVRLLRILDGIISCVESILNGFGVAHFFSATEGDVRDEWKSEKIMMLLHLATLVASLVVPLLGAVKAGLIIGGTLLTIAALSILWPFIKPRPHQLPKAINLTRQVQNGEIVGQGRKESLDEIASILTRNRHALLIGPSRVGKSLTAKAFALAVERGDYKELRGKTVFIFNTTDLIDQKTIFSGGNTILNRIKALMGRYGDDIILVFDEIYKACQNKAQIGNQLLMLLDRGGGFPHVIGITTADEYKSMKKEHEPFSLRFDTVEITNTSRDETIKILGQTVLHHPTPLLLEEGALETIYDQSGEKGPQPARSSGLLERCISCIDRVQKSPAERQKTELENRIASLRSQLFFTRQNKKAIYEQIQELDAQVQELQRQATKEKAEMDGIIRSRDLLGKVKAEMYSSVVKIEGVAQRTLNAKEMTRFLLLHSFLNRIVESSIIERSAALGIKSVIDNRLIKEALV